MISPCKRTGLKWNTTYFYSTHTYCPHYKDQSANGEINTKKAVYPANDKKHIYTLCGQNANLVHVKVDSTHIITDVLQKVKAQSSRR
jgi:hypothetical protein